MEQILEKHLEIWGERDEFKRKMAMAEIYSADIELVEPHARITGQEALNTFISTLLSQNEGFVFTERSRDTHHNIARLYWQFGPVSKPDAVTGEDVFVIENGKIQKLYVFVDKQ